MTRARLRGVVGLGASCVQGHEAFGGGGGMNVIIRGRFENRALANGSARTFGARADLRLEEAAE